MNTQIRVDEIEDSQAYCHVCGLKAYPKNMGRLGAQPNAGLVEALVTVPPMMQVIADDSGVINKTRDAAKLLADIGWQALTKGAS